MAGTLAIACALPPTIAYAQARTAEPRRLVMKRPMLIPEPQELVVKEPSFQLALSDKWVIAYPDKGEKRSEYKIIAEHLASDLKAKGLDLSVTGVDKFDPLSSVILLGESSSDSDFLQYCLQRGLPLDKIPYGRDDERYSESYVIDVTQKNPPQDNCIIVAGRGLPGLYYGVQTLSQLIGRHRQLRGVRVTDYPDSKWRGAYLKLDHLECFSNKEMGLDEAKACIRKLVESYAETKTNRLIFRGSQFHEIEKHRFLLTYLFQECRKHYIEPIPSIESKLENLPLFNSRDKEQRDALKHIEAVYTQKEPFVVGDDLFLRPERPTKDQVRNGSVEAEIDSNANQQSWKRHSPLGWWRKKTKLAHSGQFVLCNESEATSVLAYSNEKREHAHQEVSVAPESYYELGFWGRTYKNDARIKVYITQYDRRGAYLPYLGFHKDFVLGKDWHKFTLPVFTDEACATIRVSLEGAISVNRGDEVFIDDIEMFRMNGTLINALNTSQTQIQLFTATGRRLVQGEDFAVHPGPIWADPQETIGALSPTRIEILKHADLKSGEKVFVNYDSITLNPRESHSKACPSDPGTYRAYRKLFSDLLALHPKFININMDEHRGGFNRDSRCLRRNMSNGEIFSDYLTKLNNVLHAPGEVQVTPQAAVKGLGEMGIRLIIWDDMVNYYHNGGGERGQSYQLRYGGTKGDTCLARPVNEKDGKDVFSRSDLKLPRDIIIAVWWYEKDDYRNIIRKSPDYYESIGYDYFVCPWNNRENVSAWSRQMLAHKALGMMDSTAAAARQSGGPDIAASSWRRNAR